MVMLLVAVLCSRSIEGKYHVHSYNFQAKDIHDGGGCGISVCSNCYAASAYVSWCLKM